MTDIPETLLPCPFCGGPAKSAHLGGSAWFIEAEHASDCFFADFQRSEAEAVTAWNRRAAQAERMARLEEALRNLAHEMRFLLRNKPRMDGGLYRQRLSEADAALAGFRACKHNCDVGGICLAEHAGFPESCARALSQEGSDA